MACCHHCRDAESLFNQKKARSELKKYRKKGVFYKSTRKLLNLLEERGVEDLELIDVGGGVGIIQHELLKKGLKNATQVEASEPYLLASQEEAQLNASHDRLSSFYGDFVELFGELPEADIVTADRVLCCYPHRRDFIDAMAKKSRQYCAVVYPREKWFINFGIKTVNLYLNLIRSSFRLYFHGEEDVQHDFTENDFKLTERDQTFLWNVELYEKQ